MTRICTGGSRARHNNCAQFYVAFYLRYTGTANQMATTTRPINELPDFPSIKQIADALWNVGETRGAAVLVGAGFSCNAVLPSPKSRKPPLWADFAHAMRQTLYPGKAGGTWDPLKLAEEYKAALGATALDSLINDLVPDQEWQPGHLHYRLVNLPWTDILTTNWDTLLERASQSTDREDTYGTVRTIADIPRTRSPRIVKLHGSMPSNRPFVFTEEDYRRYPKDFAPFVNLVQEVLMENELCLIGFSGDDPNFLQWSGWIRDQLGESARRIYLIGVLNLSPSYRKYLEARKVTPIDLAPTVASVVTDRHREASKLLLDFLYAAKPRPRSQWLSEQGSVQSHRLASLSINQAGGPASSTAFEELLGIWRHERQNYGGWVVCPYTDRLRIRSEIGLPEHLLRNALNQLQTSERAQAAFEVAWRLDLVFFPISVWFREVLSQTMADSNNSLTHQQRTELAAILARAAREEQDRTTFETVISWLKQNSGGDQDLAAAAAYEESLWARDHLDYETIEKLMPSISGNDPAWKIRHASLLFELGQIERAKALVVDARKDIRDRFNKDRKSIWTLSRLGWAIFIARGAIFSSAASDTNDPVSLEEWPPYFARNKCLPWDELDHLDGEFSYEFRRTVEAKQNRQVTFDAGSYRETMTLFSSSGWALQDTLRLMDLVGIPPMAGSVDMMRSRLARALGLSSNYDQSQLLRIIRALGGASDKLLERTFSRIEIARMSSSTVEAQADTVRQGIQYGRARTVNSGSGSRGETGFWVERLATLIEVLSRLVVRLDENGATVVFKYACSMATAPDFLYWPLFEPLGELLNRSLSAVSPMGRQQLLPEILNFPLPDERGLESRTMDRGPYDKWPEVMVGASFGAHKPPDHPVLAPRIGVLISKVARGDRLTRERAGIRLLRAQQLGALSSDENKSFAAAVWSRCESGTALPESCGIRPHGLFGIPTPDNISLTQLFRSNVLEKLWAGLTDGDQIEEVVGATRKRADGSRAFELTKIEALRLFRLILDWRPRQVPLDVDQYNRRMGHILGRALINAVLPFVTEADLEPERIEEFWRKIEAHTLNWALVALPDLLRITPLRQNEAIEVIRRACFSSERDSVEQGLCAIDRWRILAAEGEGQLPAQITDIPSALATRTREPSLSSALYVATKLIEGGKFGEDGKKDLLVALDALRTETAYSSWDTADARTINITVIRERCVRLADALRKSGMSHDVIGYWLHLTKTDPIPEVRYALEEQDD